MPKVYLCNTEQAKAHAVSGDEALRVAVATRMMRDGLTQKEIAARVGIAPVTLSRRLAKPGTFTLGELRRLYAALGLSDTDAARVL